MIASDFADNSLTGITTIINGACSITKTLTNDFLLEGTETFKIVMRTGSPSGPIIATSPVITVGDTSVPIYTITPSTTSVNEGSTITFNINTIAVDVGTTLYYDITGSTGISTSDFTNISLSGSLVISGTYNSGTATTSLTLVNDLSIDEESETFNMNLRRGSISGSTVSVSPTITINDTSKITIVSTGLILNLDAGKTTSYSGTGNIWTDLSGSNNNGTLNGGVTYDIANKGSLVFNGSTSYIQTPITGTYAQISFDFWAFYDDPTLNTLSREESILGDWTSNRVHFATRWTGSSAGMHFNVNNVWQTTPTTNLKYGWNHYSLIYDTISNQKLVYLNGILSSSNVTNGSMVLGDFKLGVATNLGYYYRGNISSFRIYNRALSAAEVSQNYTIFKNRHYPPGLGNNLLEPLSSPVQAQSLGLAAGSYYFKSGSMSSAQLFEYQPNYYESKPFCCVFRSPYASTATTNRLDLSIPMAGLLVQRDALDLRGAVYWSTPITYTTTSGNTTADSGTGYNSSNARKVMLGNGGGHGLYNTSQNVCNWGDSNGSIGAGYNGSCGSFPNGLIWSTGTPGSAYYANTSGTWSHWVTWG